MLYLLIGKGSGHYLLNRVETLGKLIWPFDAKWIKLNRLGAFCLRLFPQWLFPSVSLESRRAGGELGDSPPPQPRITSIEMPSLPVRFWSCTRSVLLEIKISLFSLPKQQERHVGNKVLPLVPKTIT